MPKRSRKRKLAKYSKTLLIVGLVCLVFGIGLAAYEQLASRFMGQLPTVEVTDNVPLSISVPTLKLNLELEPGFILDGKWTVSSQKANYLFTAGRPGTPANTIIYGHNTRKIFGQLYRLKKGDELVITIQDGQEFEYEVAEKLTVKPDQLDYLAGHGQEELALYTCTGLLDSKRLIIRAIPRH